MVFLSLTSEHMTFKDCVDILDKELNFYDSFLHSKLNSFGAFSLSIHRLLPSHFM
jgi:hypothetical protein